MTIYLLPNLLDETASKELCLPPIVDQIVSGLNGLIAESEKGARSFLKRFKVHLPLWILNEHTKEKEIKEFIDTFKGTWGLISDAGLPCLADPGSLLVSYARQKKIEVKAICGPSSILLALMLSGLPAQTFAFHGYLEKEKDNLLKQLRSFEKQKTTHIFIEAPYRNVKLFETLLQTLSDSTTLCIASSLTSPDEYVETLPIRLWKKHPVPSIDKKPTIFLIY